MLLHDEQTGVLIEKQAEVEGLLPHQVIAEAVGLRAKQKSGSQLVARNYKSLLASAKEGFWVSVIWYWFF